MRPGYLPLTDLTTEQRSIRTIGRRYRDKDGVNLFRLPGKVSGASESQHWRDGKLWFAYNLGENLIEALVVLWHGEDQSE